MQTIQALLDRYKQNNKLSIRLISPNFGHVPSENLAQYGLTHRKPYYFFLFMIKGSARHGVDLQQFEIKNNELLFILPHQIHQLPAGNRGTDYFKIGFDENCLSLLPKQYPFLINPYNNPKIRFTADAATRLIATFQVIQNLLKTKDTDPDLILAHLNSLLTEINIAYFSKNKPSIDNKLSTYIRFKTFIENNLTDHITITHIAAQLTLNPNSLYSIVKRYSGLSPKEYITNRLVLEAKRRLYYSESASIKELAYGLGFNDPEYFSRLFKKTTGKTVATFMQEIKKSSGY